MNARRRLFRERWRRATRWIRGWKPFVYSAVLPALRQAKPWIADRLLRFGGRIATMPRLGWHRRARLRIEEVSRTVDASWDRPRLVGQLAEGLARFTARDVLLENVSLAELSERFEISGSEFVRDSLRSGRGIILLGSHFGGHLGALHWMVRTGLSVRFLVQRPYHASKTLLTRFDAAEGPHAQSGFCLTRDLTSKGAVSLMMRARIALLDGWGVYLNGDIPWPGCNTRRGTLLGLEQSWLAIWADLAALTGAPVVPVFCEHRGAGRYRLIFEAPRVIQPGSEDEAVQESLGLLESRIIARPDDAPAHLLWPCYGGPASKTRSDRADDRKDFAAHLRGRSQHRRPSRRLPVFNP